MDYLGCLTRIGSWSNEKILRQQDEHEYEDARAYLYVLSLLKQNKGRGMTYSSMQEDIKHAS